MRTLVAGALLVVMPFGGVRVVCYDSPAPEAQAPSPEARAISDCERMCPFHPPADETSVGAATSAGAEEGSGCTLSSDSMSLNMFGHVAAFAPDDAMQQPPVRASLIPASMPPLYLEPDLAGVVPPPKTAAR